MKNGVKPVISLSLLQSQVTEFELNSANSPCRSLVLPLMKVGLFDWKPELLCFPLSLGCKTFNNILLSLQSGNMKNLISPVNARQ